MTRPELDSCQVPHPTEPVVSESLPFLSGGVEVAVGLQQSACQTNQPRHSPPQVGNASVSVDGQSQVELRLLVLAPFSFWFAF